LVVLAEAAFVLTGFYQVDRVMTVEPLVNLLSRRSIEVHEVPTGLAIEALTICAPSARVSFADAMLWATARHAAASAWTFDRKSPSRGIELRPPG
jgi:hypothetical protein